MTTVHIITGLIGAGKTTLARRLERELPAIRFSLDEWIMTLFGDELGPRFDGQWWLRRAERSRLMLERVCRQALAAGSDVVLDCGYLLRQEREAARQLAASAGAASKLYLVQASAATRWQRVERRNAERGDTFAVVVHDHMFDVLPWEPPGPDELAGGVVIDT